MAIGMGARGHPDHGFSGTAGAGNTAGTGVEGAYGGAMIGPDSFAGIAPGIGPAGGYKGLAANAMNNMRGRREMANFLTGMSQRYGFDSVRNFITGYMGVVNAPVNPNMDTQEQQNSTINNAVRNYTSPNQGTGYGLQGYGFSPMGFAGMNELGTPSPNTNPNHNLGSSFNTGVFGPSYAEQAQNVNVAPSGFGPSQGLGYGDSQGWGGDQ